MRLLKCRHAIESAPLIVKTTSLRGRVVACCSVLASLLTPTYGASCLPIPHDQSIDAWGDSLTTGTPGIGGLHGTWPYQLSVLLGGRTVRNFGVSGQVSESIAAREGALVARVSVEGGELPVDGAVPVTVTNHLSIPGAGAGDVHGTLDGIPGKLAYTATYHHVFIRDTRGASPSSVPADSPFIVDDYRCDVSVIWAGRNDVSAGQTTQTVDNIARMTARIDAGRFIVLSIPNSADEKRGTPGYATVTALNRALAARFPHNFIDVRSALVAHANTDDADQRNRHADVVPVSLRVDNLHLNADGYRIVAEQVAGFVNQRGW